MATHRLSIADPMFFEGPDGGGGILVEGIGVINGSPAWQVPLESYLLSVEHPFVIDGEEVRQLVVTPRHVGGTLDDVINREPPVNIARGKLGFVLNAGDTYDGSEFVSWAIGVIHLQRA